MEDPTRLGFWPTINKIYHDRCRCAGMATAVVRIRGPLAEAPLRESLLVLQKRHPLLRAAIVEESRYFRISFDAWNAIPEDMRLSAVPLHVVERQSDMHWEACAAEEIAHDFAPDAPCLWRAVALLPPGGPGPGELILLFHHAISDGMCLASFVKDCVALCNSILRGRPLPDRSPLPLLPAPESLIDRHVKTTAHGSASAPRQAQRPPLSPWRFEADAPLDRRAPGVLFRSIGQDTVEALRRRARLERTSVNSALTAAFLQAACGDAPEPRQAAMSAAVNLRPYCSPPVGNEHFGCFISMVQTAHGVDSGLSFWERARAYQQELQHEIFQLQKKGFAPPAFHKAFISTTMTANVERANKSGAFTGGPALSNMGALEFENNEGPLEIAELFFGAPQLSGLYSIFLVACTVQGRLFCFFSFPEPLTSRSTACRLAARFAARLASAC